MRKFTVLAVVLFATLVAAGCGKFGDTDGSGATSGKAASGEEKRITNVRFDAAARKAAGCTEIKEFESEGSEHVEGKVKYKSNPPNSGNMANEPLPWGIYEDQQSDERSIHSMEHGQVVISYKGLSDKQQKKLDRQVRINPFHLLLEPRKDNPKKGVYYTAWTAQLYCRKPSAAALQYMIDEWRDNGPELMTGDANEGVGLDEES